MTSPTEGAPRTDWEDVLGTLQAIERSGLEAIAG